jgi:uncharacterized protein (TIGR02391 family)
VCTLCVDGVARLRTSPARVGGTLARVNIEWALARLEAYSSDFANYREFPSESRDEEMRAGLVKDQVAVEAILAKLGFSLFGVYDFDNVHGWSDGRDNVLRAIAMLRDQEEIEANVGPIGPVVAAGNLHSVVWDAAVKLWNDGHFGQAVQRAATFLSAHVKDRVGRHDIQDVPLMQQAFSSGEPEQGKSRLRWPGDPSNLTVKSMNDGLRQLAPGIFMTIRNTATHSTDETPEHEALEQLATLSLLARWIDSCELVEAEESKIVGRAVKPGQIGSLRP